MQLWSTPLTVEVNLTHHCNLACPFCFYRRSQQADRQDLPIDEWLQFLDELSALHVMQLDIIGGEPLIYPYLSTFIDKLVEGRMRFALISNGYFLREKGEAVFAHRNRCNWVQISVDGMRETHDRLRGAGVWDRAVDALRLLRENGISSRVNMTVSNLNAADIPELIPFLVEELGVESIRLNNVIEGKDAPLLGGVKALTPPEMLKLMETVGELALKYPQISRRSTALEMREYLAAPHRLSEMPAPRQCSAPWHQLAVRADGAMIACNGCEDEIIGWINRTPVAEIWQNHPRLVALRSRLLCGRTGLSERCRACRYNWYCSTACPEQPNGLKYCIAELADLQNAENASHE